MARPRAQNGLPLTSTIALPWVPEGKKKQDRPRETWRRTVEKEFKDRGLRSRTEAATAAEGRSA